MKGATGEASEAGESDSERSELPKGWAWATVGEVCEKIEYGLTASASTSARGPKLLRITDITDRGVDWATVPSCECDDAQAAKYQVDHGDIVFARTGATTGKSHLIVDPPRSAVFASYLIRLRAHGEAVQPEYLSAYFRTPDYWNAIVGELSGIAQPNVNGTKLAALRVPVAPLAEQRRIVAKLEAVLGRIRRAREALDAVPAMVERYKKSVLGVAFRGELSRSWRQGNPHIVDADARWLAALPSHFGWRSARRIGALSGTNSSFPSHWQQRELGDLCVFAGYGSSSKCDAENTGPAVLRIPNVIGSTIVMDDLKFAESDASIGNLPPLEPGDLLVVRTNGSADLIGRAALVSVPFASPTFFASYLIRFRLAPVGSIPQWIACIWDAPPVREWLHSRAASSAGQYNIGMGELAQLAIPLPGPNEQHAIVARIDAAFARARVLLDATDAARAQLDVLERSVLAKAFRGELVPQDPSDEPASVLLDRVRAERVEAPAKKPRKPRATQPAVTTPDAITTPVTVTAPVTRDPAGPIADWVARLASEGATGLPVDEVRALFAWPTTDAFYRELRGLIDRGRLREVRRDQKIWIVAHEN